MAFIEYDFMDQNQNRGGTTQAPATDNADQEIRTSFFTLGAQYLFNSDWGAQVELPFSTRYFRTVDGNGNTQNYNHAALGDVRLRAIYTGSATDLSNGLTFGVRIPTGDWSYPNFDRDTEIGSGSADLLLGAYHLGSLTHDRWWSWFAQINLDQPLLTQGSYMPGTEIDAAGGIYYSGFSWAGDYKVLPLFQLLASVRASDSGASSDPINTGYQRMLAAPAVEFVAGRFRVYLDVEIPFYSHFNGDQLAAPVQAKLIASVGF
jgi:hypothetical protein